MNRQLSLFPLSKSENKSFRDFDIDTFVEETTPVAASDDCEQNQQPFKVGYRVFYKPLSLSGQVKRVQENGFWVHYETLAIFFSWNEQNHFVIEPIEEVESSITESVIEPIEEVESSITEFVIEPFGFNPYEVKKKGKVYTYWRYSYRMGSKVKHKHIGSYDRVQELKKLPIGKLRVILGLSNKL